MNADILSLARHFGSRSQKWMYDQVHKLGRHRAYVLAYEFRNTGEFPHSPRGVLPARKSFDARLRRFGERLRGKRRPFFDPRERRIIRRVVAEEGIRLIQAHFGWMGLRASEVVEEVGLPFLVWVYGSDVFRRQRPGARKIEELFDSPAIFCCTSNALKRALEDRGCPEDKARVFYLGVDVPSEAPVRSPTPDGTVHICSVGRLVDVKRPQDMIKVASMLGARGIRFDWRHCGDGELRNSLERGIRAAGLDEGLHLMGEVPHRKALEAMKESDLMVHCAGIAPDGSRESFGFVLVEAAAAGIPVVSMRVGGIPEIVLDGETGYLVDEGDLEGMAERTAELSRDPELRNRLGLAGYRRASQNFESSRRISKLEGFYDGLIGSR